MISPCRVIYQDNTFFSVLRPLIGLSKLAKKKYSLFRVNTVILNKNDILDASLPIFPLVCLPNAVLNVRD
jgi:hypothetical protein